MQEGRQAVLLQHARRKIPVPSHPSSHFCAISPTKSGSEQVVAVAGQAREAGMLQWCAVCMCACVQQCQAW